jgi:hypothetical protein
LQPITIEKRKTAEAITIFILSSFTFLSLGSHSSLTSLKNTGSGTAAGAAAPPPEIKTSPFFLKKKPFSTILFLPRFWISNYFLEKMLEKSEI